MERSRREWIALADEADLKQIVTQPVDGAQFTAVFVSCGPKFYAERLMRRVGRDHGAKLIDLRVATTVKNPLTGEQNWLYSATFEAT